MSVVFGNSRFNSAEFTKLASSPLKAFSISPQAIDRVKKYRAVVEKACQEKEAVYGINTGFGYLSNVRIEQDKLDELQLNIIRSHACGVGPFASETLARAILVLRLHTFLYGNSGVSLECIQVIEACLQHDILPRIPMKGSLGASGDLAPLAHVGLLLIGEGDCLYKNKVQKAAAVFKKLGIAPLEPKAKEGLALINGTHFMASRAAFLIEEAKKLSVIADVAMAMSLDGIRGSTSPFDPRIYGIRNQPGQGKIADNIMALVGSDDEIRNSHVDCDLVQDPYSFRCVPQVHGSSRYAIQTAQTIIDNELNSVTDNPLVFENGDVISGGNFHGQYIAMVVDFLSISLSEFGSISERRVEKLTNPHQSQLPAFAIKDSGLNSGFMIPHYVSASLVSENKSLCFPASVDSIPTSANKEDHVSMGPVALTKAEMICNNVYSILAIELLTAAQALDLLAPLKPSPIMVDIHSAIRSFSSYLEKDRALSEDIQKTAEWLQEGQIFNILKNKGIDLF